ncbi:MAG: Ig-like domain-containing protein [Acidobacteriota bacterium]|nr:Ig-like domain-containing protein [Acidobacteriota bacterium]
MECSVLCTKRTASVVASILLLGLAPISLRAVNERKTHAIPAINVLAGNGYAWRIRPSLVTGRTSLDAGALIGLLENASGNPADIVTGDSASTGFSSLFRLSIETVGPTGSTNRLPYAPAGPAEYDPIRREVVFPEWTAGGLRTSRTIRISEDGTTGVWLNRFANDSGAPLTVWATLTSELDPAGPAAWAMTSSGDPTPDLSDEWVVSEPAGGGRAIGLVLGEAGGRGFLADLQADPAAEPLDMKRGSGSAAFTYQLRLEPGQEGILLSGIVLGESVQDAASRAALSVEEARLPALLTTQERSEVLNLSPRIIPLGGECELAAPWFVKPEAGAVLDGPFDAQVRAWTNDSLTTKSMAISGQYKGVDASGSVIVWISRPLDYCEFREQDILMAEHWDYYVERSLVLDSRSFSGGIGTDRRLEATDKGSCWPYERSAFLNLVDGNACLTHVDIISPADGATLDRPVNVAIQPYCPSSATLEILADGASLLKQTVQKATGRLAPDRVYYVLDPATIKAGSRKIRATITDANGCSETEEITVTIPNQPPTLTVTSPRENEVVCGQVPIQFQAADDRSLARLDVYIDGALAASMDLSGTSADDSLDWDSCKQANGGHVLEATVTDGDGETTARTINVEVRNVPIALTATRREAQLKSLADLRFTYRNPTAYTIGSFAVARKPEGGTFARVSAIPLSAVTDSSGSWVDMIPNKLAGYTYRIEALDTAGKIIGRSNEVGL